MGFESVEINFDSCMFTKADHEAAIKVWTQLIDKYSRNSKQRAIILSRYRTCTSSHAALFLIYLASKIVTLDIKKTEDSLRAFKSKMANLFSINEPNQFDELVTEICVGAFIAEKSYPIAWEVDFGHLPNLTKSPCSTIDYAIRLPDTDVAIEVTTLRIDAFDRWARATEEIRKRLQRDISSADIKVEISISSPLSVRAEYLTTLKRRELLSLMKEQKTGRIKLNLGDEETDISWREIVAVKVPNIDDISTWPSNVFSDDNQFSAIVTESEGSGILLSSFSAFSTKPKIDRRVENILIKSLRSTIDGKRHQLGNPTEPTFLIIQPGNWRILPGEIASIIETRIWPNRQYNWLTALGIYSPRKSFEKHSPPDEMTVTINEFAKIKSSKSMLDLFSGDAKFAFGVYAS